MTDSNGTTLRSNAFNVRGMKTNSSNAAMGARSYAYNALGEVTSQTDAKGQTRSFFYDLLGRKISSTEPRISGGTITKIWTWGSSAAAKNIGALVLSTRTGK